jgi:hypothetical protein
MATANLRKGAHNDPHHVAEKTVAAHFHGRDIAAQPFIDRTRVGRGRIYPDSPQASDGSFHRTAGGLESCEIMFPN